MLRRRDILRLIFLVLPFVGGVIAGIVLLSTVERSDLYAALCIFGGMLPTGIYALAVKIKEYRGLKKIDVGGFAVKTARVKYCEVSSYKKTSKYSSAVPDVYVITATSHGSLYKVYAKRSYACGAEIELYVDDSGKKVRIKDPEPESSAGLYIEMSQKEDALFDRICDTCDDDTYDVVYNAWEDEMDNAGSLSRREVLNARMELTKKYAALLDEYENNKQADGLIHITEEQMKEFFAGYGAAAKLEADLQEPEPNTEPPIVSNELELESPAEPVPEQTEREKAETINAPKAEEVEDKPAKSAAVGYKGIKKIK